MTLMVALEKEQTQHLNCVGLWAQKDGVLDGYGPVGNKIRTVQLQVEAQRRHCLYPTYISYATL